MPGERTRVLDKPSPRQRPWGRLPRESNQASGLDFDAAVRVENQVPHAVLGSRVSVHGAQEHEAAALTIDGVLPGGERHVSPAIATFPDGEADELESAERTGTGFEDQLRVGELPWGIAPITADDLHGHDVALVLGHGVLQDCRGPEADSSGYVRWGPGTPANRVKRMGRVAHARRRHLLRGGSPIGSGGHAAPLSVSGTPAGSRRNRSWWAS